MFGAFLGVAKGKGGKAGAGAKLAAIAAAKVKAAGGKVAGAKAGKPAAVVVVAKGKMKAKGALVIGPPPALAKPGIAAVKKAGAGVGRRRGPGGFFLPLAKVPGGLGGARGRGAGGGRRGRATR